MIISGTCLSGHVRYFRVCYSWIYLWFHSTGKRVGFQTMECTIEKNSSSCCFPALLLITLEISIFYRAFRFCLIYGEFFPSGIWSSKSTPTKSPLRTAQDMALVSWVRAGATWKGLATGNHETGEASSKWLNGSLFGKPRNVGDLGQTELHNEAWSNTCNWLQFAGIHFEMLEFVAFMLAWIHCLEPDIFAYICHASTMIDDPAATS